MAPPPPPDHPGAFPGREERTFLVYWRPVAGGRREGTQGRSVGSRDHSAGRSSALGIRRQDGTIDGDPGRAVRQGPRAGQRGASVGAGGLRRPGSEPLHLRGHPGPCTGADRHRWVGCPCGCHAHALRPGYRSAAGGQPGPPGGAGRRRRVGRLAFPSRGEPGVRRRNVPCGRQPAQPALSPRSVSPVLLSARNHGSTSPRDDGPRSSGREVGRRGKLPLPSGDAGLGRDEPLEGLRGVHRRRSERRVGSGYGPHLPPGLRRQHQPAMGVRQAGREPHPSAGLAAGAGGPASGDAPSGPPAGRRGAQGGGDQHPL